MTGKPPSRVSPARQVAFDLLVELRENPKLHSDSLLRSERVNALSPPDRNLTTALVMGVLRWEIALDDRIAAVLTQGKSHLPPAVDLALELGALQLLLLERIPPHAAIFESVELAKQSGNPRAAGLANAVLRKLAGGPRLGAVPDRAQNARPQNANQIARVWAHPQWLVARWVKQYGAAATEAICRYDQYPPSVILRLAAGEAEAMLAEEGIELEPAAWVSRARRVVKGDAAATRAFVQKQLRIQDEASQLVAEVAALATTGRPPSILDCCAAPGGKTAVLAERNPESRIVACDIHPSRLEAMKRLLVRQTRPGQIEYRAVDAAELSYDREFDVVLCDAPCSGTGTLARNPEIRHRLAPEDLSRQQARQIKILSSAMQALAPGGVLVYSTCSLEPEENENAIEKALKAEKGFRLEPWRNRMLLLEQQGILHPGATNQLWATGSSPDFLRTLPGTHPCDGFFGALIMRES